MVSIQIQNLVKLLLERNSNDITKRVEDSRKSLEELSNLVRIPRDVKVIPVDVDGITSVWITAPESKEEYVILYLHGGGYSVGSIKTHKDLASRIGRASKARVLLIEYRLAPEHKFPAAVEDAYKAYKWLIEQQKIDSKNIIIAGDSAGGGLTLSLLGKIKDTGDVLPAAAVCLSPWTDLALTGDSIKTKLAIDPFIAPYDLHFDAFKYMEYQDPTQPLASPLYANLKGLPPLLIQVGSNEVLLDDSVRFAEKAKNEGVKVELDIWEDLFHVFQSAASLAPESQQAIDKIGDFVLKIFG